MRVGYFVNKKILVTTTMFFCSENNCGYIIQVCEQIKRISLNLCFYFVEIISIVLCIFDIARTH